MVAIPRPRLKAKKGLRVCRLTKKNREGLPVPREPA